MAKMNWRTRGKRELARLTQQHERDAAAWLRENDPAWRAPRVSKAKTREWLDEKISQYQGPITYWTAWREIKQPFPSVAGAGAIAFERDKVRKMSQPT